MVEMPVHPWVSLVSLVGKSMGTTCNPTGGSLCGRMGRFFFSIGFQFVPRILPASFADSEKKKTIHIQIILPGFVHRHVCLSPNALASFGNRSKG